MTSENANIPRYLRYKNEDGGLDDGWNYELERANHILHTRILRMHRDKLCVGCARFDWLRTQFYTRDVHWIDEEHKRAGQKIDNGYQQSFNSHLLEPELSRHHFPYRELENVRDDVVWPRFEVVAGARREAKWLAKDPRFCWQLRKDQVHQCRLCNVFWNRAEAAGEVATLHHSRDTEVLNIRLTGGPVFEDGGEHQCIVAWPDFETDARCATSGVKVQLWGNENDLGPVPTSCCIRPFIEEMPHQLNDLPHCCLKKRRVGTNVNFDLVIGWLKLCDETHEHTISPVHSISALEGLRFIDTKSRCVIEQDQHVRYAALSYTWGSEEQYCLERGNVEVLKEPGSLDRTNIAIRKVIVDAIEVCVKADIPYLWVDALCIVQDDEQGKMFQIQNMDSVYSNAYITIVQAAEKQMNLDQSPQDKNPSLGLSGVSAPFTPIEPSFAVDGVSYLVDNNNIQRTLDESFSSTKWSSRGWTFQELVLSRRILLFISEEVVFYCSNGVACESISLSDDLYRTLPPMAQPSLHQESSIQNCGFLYGPPSNDTTLTKLIEQYEENYLQLLSFYIGRSLTYDTDVINAFSGIVNAQSISLGLFKWGMPLRLFARALFLSVEPESGLLSRRSGFPSWSWIGWKLEVGSPRTVLNDGGYRKFRHCGYWTLVQIFSCTESGNPVLLLGPLNPDNGIEGYCSRSIELYNELTSAPSLPTEPCVEEVPLFHVPRNESLQTLLMFWTHVAPLKLAFPTEKRAIPEVHIDCPMIRAKFKEEASLELEVALIAITRGVHSDDYYGGEYGRQSWQLEDGEQEISGIIIERWRGLARRVGVVHSIAMQQWVAANPKKELLLLA